MKIFISYTSSDREWAHWIGWQLKKAGHEPIVHDWEIGAGENIAGWMEESFKLADRLIGVFSDAYCEAAYSQSERWAAFWEDPRGRNGFLIPIEVRKVTDWPGFVRPLKRLSLIDCDEERASAELFAFLRPAQGPIDKPNYPGSVSASLARTVRFEGGDPLGSRPPEFPTAALSKKKAANAASCLTPVSDPSADVRCIDDHEPKPQIFGRDNEVETLVRAILNDKTVLVAGGPGMGKTAISIAALYDPRVIEHFGRRRVFASLETATEARAILAKLVETLGVSPAGDEASLLRILETNAAERPLAAVLDNAETVLDLEGGAAERLLNLIVRIKGLSIIVTVRGVAPTVPTSLQIDDLAKLDTDAARSAFLAVAGVSFGDDKDLPHLLNALDGHALSIRLVAAQAIGLPTLKLLRESWDEVHAEILRASGEETRLTSVRVSLALSLDSRRMKSTPLARRLMTLLALLPGGLAENDVHSLLGERGTITKAKSNEAMVCLHQMRLVERRPDNRLRMVNPLRECVKSEVAPIEADRRRLIERYLTLAVRAQTIGSKGWAKHREGVTAEADNLDAVCEIAIAAGVAPSRLEPAIIGLVNFHRFSGRGTVGSLDRVTAQLKGKPVSHFSATCLRSLGLVERSRSNNEVARKHLEQALGVYRRLAKPTSEANCMVDLGDLAREKDEYDLAWKCFEQALAIYRRNGTLLGEANCLRALGDIARLRSEHVMARKKIDEALGLCRRIGEILGEANCIFDLALMARTNSQYDIANTLHDEALKLFRSIGDVLGEANCICDAGGLALSRGEWDVASKRFEDAMALYRHLGSVMGEANCIRDLGKLALISHENQIAQGNFEEALMLFQRIGDVMGEASCTRLLGENARRQSDLIGARSHIERAVMLYRRAASVTGEAESTVRLGQLFRSRNEEEGLARMEAGFALYFKTADPEDRALTGWKELRRALICTNAIEAEQLLAQARVAWIAIGRLDLVWDWIDEPGTMN